MMKKNLTTYALVAFIGLVLVSCSKDDDGPPRATLTLEVVGLETLTSGARYEGWLMVDGEPKSTGKFSSTSSSQTFSVVASDLENATAFELTVEPGNDSDSGPSDSKLLSGTFVGSSASLAITGVIADLSSALGNFVIATPTDNPGTTDNDEFGIWFEDPTGIQSAAGLTLPTLADGWKYEGWVVFDGTPVTTGTFIDENGADDASPYSGNGDAPNFPGEDFLNSAPQGLTFPDDADVRGNMVMITIEPSPDYDQATPFFLKPLSGMAGQDTSPALNSLTLDSTAPFGRVLREQ